MNRGDHWETRAACNDHPTLPPSTWDGDIHGEVRNPSDAAGKRARLMRYDAAITVCERRCPVRDKCLKGAIAEKAVGVIRAGVPFGITTAEAKTVRAMAGLPPKPKRSRGGHRPGHPKAKCGSESGARRHRDLGEPVCDPCRLEANRAHSERQDKRKQREAESAEAAA